MGSAGVGWPCVGLRGSGDRRIGVFFAAEFVVCGVFKLALIKGNSGFSTSWAQMKEHEISKERAITDFHTPPGSWAIDAQSHKHRRRHFLDFKPHFRLNEDQNDVTGRTTKNSGKIEV